MPTGTDRRVVEPVVVYAALAYGISWACWLPLAWAGRLVVVGGWPTHLPGLLGPAAAAVVASLVFGGRDGAVWLAGPVLRWRIGRWWLVAVSPLLLVFGDLAVRGAAGDGVLALREFGEMNGLPQWTAIGTMILLFITGLGEETGWRGFLQPVLQRRMRPLLAVLVVAAIWAAWHAPLFLIVANYRGFTPLMLVGFVVGLACGAVVLGWLYNRTGSVLAAAVWHGSYNLTAATAASHGLLAAISTTAVIAGATTLVVGDLLTRGRVLATAGPAELT
jgi:membrane protease YdiL (CAAX protease family)